MSTRGASLNDTPLVENKTPNTYSFAYGVDSLKDFTSFAENSASSNCYICIYDEHNKSIITSM